MYYSLTPMKKILTVLVLLLPLAGYAQTQEAALYREGEQMNVLATIRLNQSMVKGVKAFVLQPQISDGEHVVKLSPIGMYTQQKFYPYLKAYGFNRSKGEMIYTQEQLPTTVRISTEVPYERWMDGAQLQLVHLYEGCCGDSGIEAVDSLATYLEDSIRFTPVFRQIPRELTMKTASLGGSAAIDFAVSSTKLDEKFHNNAAELGKIAQSIREVTNDDSMILEEVIIRAQASPEGKYATNERLAKARSQAVLGYVSSHFDFTDGVIKAEAVAENWEGLREYVESSSLKNREKILDIIDNEDLTPDTKEQRIRSKYPADWKTLGKDCFPFLRRTAYIISYKTVDVEASITNVEKATKAMEAGNFEAAAAFLARCGDDPEAEFARGTYFGSMGLYEEAAIHYQKAADGGIKEAKELAAELGRAKYINPDKPVPEEEVPAEE